MIRTFRDTSILGTLRGTSFLSIYGSDSAIMPVNCQRIVRHIVYASFVKIGPVLSKAWLLNDTCLKDFNQVGTPTLGVKQNLPLSSSRLAKMQ